MWGCMRWTGPLNIFKVFGHIYNSSYYHHIIRMINLSHCCHIFPWLWAWGGWTIMCCSFIYLCIYIYTYLDSMVLFLSFLCSVMMCASNWVDWAFTYICREQIRQRYWLHPQNVAWPSLHAAHLIHYFYWGIYKRVNYPPRHSWW